MYQLKTNYFIKKDKSKSNGQAPIYCKITVNNTSTTVTTGIYILPIRWNKLNMLQLTPKHEDEIIKKNMLDNFKNMVNKHYSKLQLADEKNITASRIKQLISGNNESTSKNIIDICNNYIKVYDVLKGNTNESETTKKYKRVVSYMKDFILATYGGTYMVSNNDTTFLNKFERYLRTDHINKNTHTIGIENNTAVKYARAVNTMLNDAEKIGVIKINPLKDKYDGKLIELDTTYLDDDEINALLNAKNLSKSLELTRDIFILDCYVGLSPIDLMALTPSNIKQNKNGNQYIDTFRSKTKVHVQVPLIDAAKTILNKYKNDYRCIDSGKIIPPRSNQQMNSSLKDLMKICKIEKSLNWYVARHTFATTITMKNGVPLQVVSKLMGHTNIEQTLRYAKVLNITIFDEMNKVNQLY